MGSSKTSGIHSDAAGNKIINKQYDGTRIYERLGKVSQADAEACLAERLQRIRLARERGSRPRVTFREAAVRYLRENRSDLASIDTVAYHVNLLDTWVGDKALDEVFDETLTPFIEHRLEVDKVSRTTVNRSLEIVRRILNLAARSYRHPNRMTWLDTAPLITISKDRGSRKPYPLSWDEQDMLLAELPADPNRQMAMFKVNTGCREQEVCQLRWQWETYVPELKTSVFIVPASWVKNGEDRLVILNQQAQQVIEERRGIHPEFVFTWRGKPSKKKPLASCGTGNGLDCMNNTAWQHARIRAAAAYAVKFGRLAADGFARVRVHDLKHTFGRRLRSAGVSDETRKVLLGHKNGDITTHYSAVELAELITAVNKIDRSLSSPVITLLKAAA